MNINPNGVTDADQSPETCSEPGHVRGCTGRAGGDHELDSAPDDDWTEDEEGYVVAPLSYENREGDPAFNGAFDRW